MPFNSLEFLLFFPAVVLIYFLTPYKYRWIPLLAAGFYFYLHREPLYLLVLVISIMVDYFFGLRMGKAKNKNERIYYLVLSISCNLGLLVVFRYLGFFTHLPLFMNIAVPLGLSYFTLKKLGYIIGIYREQIKPEVHPGIFALYVSFFPQVTAGPIDRAKDLLDQFREHRCFDASHYSPLVGGLKLMAWGMFKKVVVADRLAIFVNQVYARPADYPGIGLIMATLFFSIQIYADFSGYSDLAIGMAQVMGFRSADNFNRPYSAVSIADFWRRWHITLTTWLRDYLFLPMAYSTSRKTNSFKLGGLTITAEAQAYVLSVFCTMLLCGLWHGTSWTFVAWGGLHGLYLAVSFATRRTRKKLRKKLIPSKIKNPYRRVRVLLTFLMVSLLWVFFRANSLSDAWYIISHLFTGLGDLSLIFTDSKMFHRWILLGQPVRESILALFVAAGMVWFHRIQPHETIREMFSHKSLLARWMMYILLIMAIMNFGVFNEVPFIYAQF
jgi:alginate O-acetyltransferase complex protein AlgI